MAGNIEDIMNSSSGRLDEQKLMDYLQGKLSPDQAHEVEKMMADSGFLDDAVEGLSSMKDKQRIATILSELNSKLQTKTHQQKKKFTPLIPDTRTLALVALITILLLIIIGFVLFKMVQTS